MNLADWGHAYRCFVTRQKFLGRWPFRTEEERRDAWREWMRLSIYGIGE